MSEPTRSTTPRRQSDIILTRTQVERWALGLLAGIFLPGLFMAWRLSAQTSGVIQTVADAKATADSAQRDIQTLRRTQQFQAQVIQDLVLLKCAEGRLNDTERAICAKYEPRMPR